MTTLVKSNYTVFNWSAPLIKQTVDACGAEMVAFDMQTLVVDTAFRALINAGGGNKLAVAFDFNALVSNGALASIAAMFVNNRGSTSADFVVTFDDTPVNLEVARDHLVSAPLLTKSRKMTIYFLQDVAFFKSTLAALVFPQIAVVSKLIPSLDMSGQEDEAQSYFQTFSVRGDFTGPGVVSGPILAAALFPRFLRSIRLAAYFVNDSASNFPNFGIALKLNGGTFASAGLIGKIFEPGNPLVDISNARFVIPPGQSLTYDVTMPDAGAATRTFVANGLLVYTI